MPHKKKKRLLSLLNFGLASVILFLGIKINEKNNWISHIPYKQVFQFTNWFPYEKWFPATSLPVSSTQIYHQLVDDMYISDSNQVQLIHDGIVLSHDENSVRILQDNGVEARYSHMNQVFVKDDERLYEGSLLGTYEEFIMLEFIKDNEKMDYESVRLLP